MYVGPAGSRMNPGSCANIEIVACYRDCPKDFKTTETHQPQVIARTEIAVLRKVLVELDAPSIKRYDGEGSIVRSDQANEDWWNANKYNVHWGVISG